MKFAVFVTDRAVVFWISWERRRRRRSYVGREREWTFRLDRSSWRWKYQVVRDAAAFVARCATRVMFGPTAQGVPRGTGCAMW
jgi:hypothetical protein